MKIKKKITKNYQNQALSKIFKFLRFLIYGSWSSDFIFILRKIVSKNSCKKFQHDPIIKLKIIVF